MSDAEERPPSTRRESLRLDFSASTALGDGLLTRLEQQVRGAVSVLAQESDLAGEVRVCLVRDAEMAALHERHSGVTGTTDVLTFDLRDDPSNAASPLDVDVIVCVDEASRQAVSRAIPLEHELTLYVIHGILHVLGHDDHDDDAYQAMHAREDRILSAAGLGAIFSAPESQESVS